MSDIYAIVQALKQVEANTFSGALDDEGHPRKDMPIGATNSGFKLSISANKVVIKYQEELPIADVQKKSFDTDVKQKMADILRYLKKEYKLITGKAVSLKQEGKVEVFVQSLSRFRTWVNARQVFTIGGVGDEVAETPEKALNENIRKFIGIKTPKFKEE
jgi:hypothetical protein